MKKAITILNWLKPQAGITEWSSTEISKKANLHPATTHRILSDLLELGFVGQNVKNRKFYLGSELIILGTYAKSLYKLKDVIRPYLEELATKTNESIYLTLLDSNLSEATLIDTIDSEHSLRIVEPIGLKLPLHIGSPRKVILAYLSEDQLNNYIENCTWIQRTPNTICSEEDLRKDLEKIKRTGFSLSIAETSLNTAGIAVPLFNETNVIGSIAIAFPESRLEPSKIEVYSKLLLEVTQKINYLPF